MNATVATETVPTEAGNLFTPDPIGRMPRNIERLSDRRLVLHLSDADMNAYLDAKEDRTHAVVTDLTTGYRFEVAAAACGLGCRCAASARHLPA